VSLNTLKHSILLVEDDESLGSTLVERLSEEPYDLTWVRSVKDALSHLEEKAFDLHLLDIGLPDGSGFNVAREIKLKHHTPIIFLTAMNSAEYRLEGFEIGCDDYIPKPFHLKELLLRIAKVFEGRLEQKTKRASGMVLHAESYSIVLPDGRTAELSQRDFELLSFLIEVSPRAVARQEILQHIFCSDAQTNRTVDNSIVRIRTTLGTFGEGKLRSVRGVGYQWLV
jgi:two-component system phosphate regulon response regulator PhoB